MRYVIYGAGAIGGAIGARLHQAGTETVLIARGPHLAAMRAKGLRFDTPDGSVTLPIPVAGHPRELRFGDGDVVLLTMKSQDSEAAMLDLLAAPGGGDVPIICAQNGVENERLALRHFARVYAMLVILPATYLEPGVVEVSCAPVTGVLDTGRYPAGTDRTAVEVCAGLESAGFSARPDARVMRLKYAKLLSNLGNTLQAALGDMPAGQISRLLITEAVACYQAAGIEWTPDDEMARRRQAMSPPRGRRGGGSTWQSLARGAGSIESDYLNGEIALLGRLHGVPTPANSALQRIGRRLVAEGRAPGSMTAAEVMREIEGE